MFEHYNVKKLKQLIGIFKKEHNLIGSVSKMKKAELVREMEKYFVIESDRLVIKPKETQPKPKKVVTPTNVTAPPSFRGQNTERELNEQLERRIKLKEQMKKDIKFARRLKGTS
jgi:hypothetical protein